MKIINVATLNLYFKVDILWVPKPTSSIKGMVRGSSICSFNYVFTSLGVWNV